MTLDDLTAVLPPHWGDDLSMTWGDVPYLTPDGVTPVLLPRGGAGPWRPSCVPHTPGARRPLGHPYGHDGRPVHAVVRPRSPRLPLSERTRHARVVRPRRRVRGRRHRRQVRGATFNPGGGEARRGAGRQTPARPIPRVSAHSTTRHSPSVVYTYYLHCTTLQSPSVVCTYYLHCTTLQSPSVVYTYYLHCTTLQSPSVVYTYYLHCTTLQSPSVVCTIYTAPRYSRHL